ncbi:MAG: peptidase M10 [Methylomonas sp.]|uniref:peptidase M10 n=1 Tax=Methylomonas sp. TaxID=418 RepID=UPI0025E9D0FB|nr:peptidase M10 [Methylomonas sp.]MCK9607636.1 peptidase M10 [Methylomonas sp.]
MSLLFGGQAYAHVDYTVLPQNADITTDVITDFAWYEGTQPALANSHDFRWFSFDLTEPSKVNISVAATGAGNFSGSEGPVSSVGALDVAFTLYNGVVPLESIESDTLTGTGFIGFGGFDDQGVATTQDQTTAASAFVGAGPGDVTLGNADGDWATIGYITHVNNGGSGVTELLNNWLLQAGTYTLLVGGASQPIFDVDGITLLNDGSYGLIANLSVQAVPVPGAVWLFGSAIIGLIGCGRRKTVAYNRF